MPKKTFPTLTTERLLLRALSRDDIDQYSAIRSDPAIMESTGLSTYPPHDTARAEHSIVQAERRFEQGRFISWGIFPRAARILAGVIYETINPRNSRAEIGYYAAQSGQGKGYMTEALAAVTAHNFDAIDLDRQQAWVIEGNVASERVLEKNGFVFEGTLLDYIQHPDGSRRDVKMYGLVRPR
jgi:ribosomal-protein-alanine N-acetyltransferase